MQEEMQVGPLGRMKTIDSPEAGRLRLCWTKGVSRVA